MGIKNLLKFLQKHLPTLFQKKHISEYSGKKVAIDVTLYLYRYKTFSKSRWMSSFINLILLLKKHNIQGIFIYDTKAPLLKSATIQDRKRRRSQIIQRVDELKKSLDEYHRTGEINENLMDVVNKTLTDASKLLKDEDMKAVFDVPTIEQEIARLEKQIVYVSTIDINQSKKLLELMGIVYINSESEAETLCAHLCCNGYVDAVLSNDSDVMVYGTPVFITNLSKGMVDEVRFDQIMKGLEMTQNEFRDFCIMCGTDYNNNIYRVGNEKVFKFIKKHSSIENIAENTNLDISVLNHTEVREIFRVPEITHEIDLEEKPYDHEGLTQFLVENNVDVAHVIGQLKS